MEHANNSTSLTAIAADGTSRSNLVKGIHDDGTESEFVAAVFSNKHFYLLENVSDPGYSFVSVTKINASTLEYVTEYTIIGDTSATRPVGQHITADDDGSIYVSYRYPSYSETVVGRQHLAPGCRATQAHSRQLSAESGWGLPDSRMIV